MSEIDRRTLISMAGVAGAGLALSGCGGVPDGAQDNAVRDRTDARGAGKAPGGGTEYGECDEWGDLVNKPYPFGGDFTPRYICAAYLQFGVSGPIVRQGYLKWDPDTPENDLIVGLLQSLRTPNAPSVPVGYKRYNFDTLSMRGPHIFVVYIDNKSNYARFPTVNDIKDDPAKPGDVRPLAKSFLTTL